MIAAVQFYDVVRSLHILSVVAAFGPPFAYPLLISYVDRNHPEASAAAYGAVGRLNRFVTGPAALLTLVLGIYMASDHDLFDEAWVSISFVILIVVMGISGAVIGPRGRRAEVLAEQGGPVEEIHSMRSAVIGAAWAMNALILLAIFFMTAKPFA